MGLLGVVRRSFRSVEMVLSSFELLEPLEARGKPGCMPSLPRLRAYASSCRVTLLDLCMFSPPLREAGDPEISAREPFMLSSRSKGHAAGKHLYQVSALTRTVQTFTQCMLTSRSCQACSSWVPCQTN